VLQNTIISKSTLMYKVLDKDIIKMRLSFIYLYQREVFCLQLVWKK